MDEPNPSQTPGPQRPEPLEPIIVKGLTACLNRGVELSTTAQDALYAWAIDVLTSDEPERRRNEVQHAQRALTAIAIEFPRMALRHMESQRDQQQASTAPAINIVLPPGYTPPRPETQ